MKNILLFFFSLELIDGQTHFKQIFITNDKNVIDKKNN